jgi:asparagine synthase (glutamine-hydrolysing)
MIARIRNRGPDGTGFWQDKQQCVGLGHCRLAIIDTSQNGSQPMTSHCARYTIAFNGEIYNHTELRASVNSANPITWSSNSDTESLLEHIGAFGLRATLEKAVGMFAFALWDARESELFLCRDRMGEKPLYYHHDLSSGLLSFGSQPRAILAVPGVRTEIDQEAAYWYFRHGYIPASCSVYSAIKKVQSGTTIRFKVREGFAKDPTVSCYWNLGDAVSIGRATPFAGTLHDASDELENLLRRSISQQLIADVPLGAFLSGGLDSSTVVAIAQRCSSTPLRTFSIGFADQMYDESKYARQVANALGTDHTEYKFEARDAFELIPSLSNIWDEPFSDSSQLPTTILAEMTKQSVTVSLSGDGGDELFHGYDRYTKFARWNSMPYSFARKCLAAAWSGTFANTRLLDNLCRTNPSLGLIVETIKRHEVEDRYESYTTLWHIPSHLRPASTSQFVPGSSNGEVVTPANAQDIASIIDLCTYLPDDILVKVDRAAMNFGLETRIPFLDHRIVEFAMSLPSEMKSRAGTAKAPILEVASRHLPAEYFAREKMGFGVPLGSWLNTELFQWAEDIINTPDEHVDHFIGRSNLERSWNQHREGQFAHSARIWNALVWNSWRAENYAIQRL